jgi:hypothetical protein
MISMALCCDSYELLIQKIVFHTLPDTFRNSVLSVASRGCVFVRAHVLKLNIWQQRQLSYMLTVFIWYCKCHLFWLSVVKGGYINTCTHRQQVDIINLLLFFFQNKESRVEMGLKE